MSSQMPNVPMMPGGSTSFVQTWIDALTKPNEQTYGRIAASPRAKATTAYFWVFVTNLIFWLLYFAVQGGMIRQRLAESGIGGAQFGSGFPGMAVGLLCAAPIAAIVMTLFFAVHVALVQWIAKMFGGRGTNDQLAYAFAAIDSPYYLLLAVVGLFGIVRLLGICVAVISLAAVVYVIVLQVMAVKGVNQFGLGEAVGSYFVPGVAAALIGCCAALIVGTLSGIGLRDLINQVQPSLTQ